MDLVIPGSVDPFESGVYELYTNSCNQISRYFHIGEHNNGKFISFT